MTPTAPSLPYGHGDAPLARFLQTIADGQRSATAPWLGWLSGLVLAAALSLLLGTPVLLMTTLAVGLILLARALLRCGRYPALCLALLDVALPWAAGAALVWPIGDGETRRWLLQIGILAAAFTALQWGVYRARFSAGRHTVLLWLGQIMVLGVLIALRQPWAVAVGSAAAHSAGLVVGSSQRGRCRFGTQPSLVVGGDAFGRSNRAVMPGPDAIVFGSRSLRSMRQMRE